jgi:hypothetical protein
VAAKKKKKTEKNEQPEWLFMWTDANIDELKKLEHGWATIHPVHGIINHDTIGLIHLLGKNRFIKRSIMKACVHIDVAASLRTYALINPFHAAFEGVKKAFKPFTSAERETERAKMREETKKDEERKKTSTTLVTVINPDNPNIVRPDGLSPLAQAIDLFDNDVVLDDAKHPSEWKEPGSVELAEFAKKHSLKATDVLMKLLEQGMTGVHIHTLLDKATIAQLEEQFGIMPGLPLEAKTSPHKQPAFKPHNKANTFDRGMVLDGYGARVRRDKMRID